MSYIFFDTETSGIGNNARVIQFSALVADENFTVTDTIDEYCMIDGEIPPEVIQIHGIDKGTLAKLSGGQTILDVVEKHKNILRAKGNVWVGYNTPFDIRKVQDSIDYEKMKALNEEDDLPEYILSVDEPVIDFGTTVKDSFPKLPKDRNVNYDLMKYYFKKYDLKVYAKLNDVLDRATEGNIDYVKEVFRNHILETFKSEREVKFHDALFDAYVCWFLCALEGEALFE